MPFAIPSIRSFVRASLSSITSEIVPFALSKSLLFAVKISSAFSINASAILRRALFFSSVESEASKVLTFFASIKISFVVIIIYT